MPTVIDSLIVTLGLDSTNFQKGEKEVGAGLKKTKDESTDVAKTMEQNGKKAGAFFGSIRNELLALIGITLSLKGMKDLIIGTANNMAQLGRSAAPLNMSARELDAWQTTAKATGGTAEGLTGSMQSLSDSIYAFSIGKGGTEAINTLNALGIAAVDAQGKAKNMGQIYLEVSEQFQKRHLSIGLARQYGAGLGMDAATINLLMEGPDKVRKLQQEMYNRSGVSPEAVARSQKFQETWAKIEQTFEGVRQNLFTALIPYIEKLLVQLDRFATWVATHQHEINKFFKDTAETIASVTDAVGGVQNAFEILLAFVAIKWVAGMLGAIDKVSGALGGVATAVSAAGIYATVAAGNEVVGRTKALIDGKPYDQIQGNNAELSEIERLKRDNWDKNNPGVPYPEDTQRAQAAKATGKGKALLDWMTGQFASLEQQYQLPEGLLKRVATTESGGNQFAISGAGAKGLFQFMDPTARDMGLKGNDVFDPEKSAQAAAKYLNLLLKATGGDVTKAIAAYNWGIGNVQKKGLGNAPQETVDYIDRVLGGTQTGAAVAASQNVQHNNSSTRTETNIQNLNVNTQATDARTIANELPGHIRRNGLVASANGGVS